MDQKPLPQWSVPTYARWAVLHHLLTAFLWAIPAAVAGALRFNHPLFSAAFLFFGVMLSAPLSLLFVWDHQSTLLDFQGDQLHYRSYGGAHRIIPHLCQDQLQLKQSPLEARFDVGRICIPSQRVCFYGVSRFALTRNYLLVNLPPTAKKEPAAVQQTPDNIRS